MEDHRLKDAGYISNDEKGTADVPMDGDAPLAGHKKSKSKKRKLPQGARDSGNGDGLADFHVPEDLEDDASPAEKRLKGVLESDDD